jgi:hypothetical protein
MKPRTSLRGKITFGYYAVGTLIVGLSLYAFVELSLIKEKVLTRERVSDFFDAALEIRRFEKNYFLYHQPVDYQENVHYSMLALDRLDQNATDFADLLPSSRREAATAVLIGSAPEQSSHLHYCPDSAHRGYWTPALQHDRSPLEGNGRKDGGCGRRETQ